MRRLSSLTTALLLIVIMTSCGRPRPRPTPVTDCRGPNCVNFSSVRADFCPQYDITKPNEAYFSIGQQTTFNLPIHIFFSVIQTDSSGVDQPSGPEQHYRIPSTEGLVLPICHTTTVTGKTYTQKLHFVCATNRSLLVSDTSAACQAGETLDQIVNVFSGSFQRAYLSRMSSLKALPAKGDESQSQKRTHPDRENERILWAPSTLAPDEVADCTALCDVSSPNCIRLSSASLNAKLLNLVTNWIPGKTLDKGDGMAALGVTKETCNRSQSVVSSQGTISNKGDDCVTDLDFQDNPVKLVLPTEVTGLASASATGRKIQFDVSKEPIFEFPDDLAVYGGPVLTISAPSGTTVADMRTKTACVRVSEH